MTDLEFNLFFNIQPKDPFKEAAAEYFKEFRKTPAGKEYNRNYQNFKYKTDLNHRIKVCLRSRIWSTLKGKSKSQHTMELVGCNIEFLKNHISSKFSEGMTWSNYGKWEIDHVRPCSSFDLSKPEEQALCFHYTNLQPLWAVDNLAKSNKCSFK